MATFTDDDIIDDEEGAQGGKGLRKQLETALSQNRQLQERLGAYEAEKVLAAKGWDLVKPEELKGVAPDQIEAHAEKLQNERLTLQETLLKAALAKFGIEEDALEDAVAEVVGRQSADTDGAAQVQRIRSLGRSDTRPVPSVNPDKLHGIDAIRAGLDQRARSTKRR